MGGHDNKFTDSNIYMKQNGRFTKKKKVKLIFLFNMNEIKCFVYGPTSMYLVSLNGFVYSCAIRYKLGQPDSAFCVMKPY